MSRNLVNIMTKCYNKELNMRSIDGGTIDVLCVLTP